MIKHKKPVEESFIAWIVMNPDSFHHLDMQRFYVFVHSVIRYNATSWLSFVNFKKKILLYKPNFSQEHIEYFFNLMRQFVDFSKATYLPTLEFDGYSKTTIRSVEKGSIVIKTVE